jgi:hypothetical protein
MRTLKLRLFVLLLANLSGAAFGDPPTRPASGRIQAFPDNPHYLAWGETPVFPLGATGYHSWTYFRYTRWRSTRAVAQLLANLGASFPVNSRIFRPAENTGEDVGDHGLPRSQTNRGGGDTDGPTRGGAFARCPGEPAVSQVWSPHSLE